MANLQPYHMGHLPVWASGNVYLNGAKAWKKETNNLIVPDKKVTVELIDHNGKPALQTNLYDVIGNFKNNIINSAVLGKAFEPEQRFETPDGDSIQISEDYFGNHRGISTIPGPFATSDAAGKDLWNEEF
ncbi:hypothetical protein [Limosilactobacillus oris]|uniref:hypothetical protein n=1 Tax=Limosilactobacillus oris TaxID=1632 RepID=UPI0024B32913|nr:hypothetical protein [Limosilactobacillus oris]WHO85837.1 hypothetical protein QLX69_00910 [Limosilactobacillus oris]